MITPADHFRVIEIRPSRPLPQMEAHALVPQYALEPAPRKLDDGGGTSTVTQIINDNLSSALTQISVLNQMIACFNITCNGDGTLSWTFTCP